MTSHRIIIADDHPLFRDALKLALASSPFPADVEEAGNLDAVIAILDRDSDFDLILLDLRMPGVQGYSGLVLLRAQFPSVPVMVVSASDEPSVVRRCLDLGASGFIPKSLPAESMREAVSAVLAGGVWAPRGLAEGEPDNEAEILSRRLSTLTPQQVRVLMMVREGLLNKQIAHQLNVSEATIKAHVSAILQKLDVGSRTQAVIAVSKLDG
ncbi:response regulator transcription factor [soil metagenome]